MKVSFPTSDKFVWTPEKIGLTSEKSVWPSQKLPSARKQHGFEYFGAAWATSEKSAWTSEKFVWTSEKFVPTSENFGPKF